MTNVINKYETIFVIDASLPEEQITAITTEGYYVLVNFASEAEFVAELERVYNITDGMLRTIVIRK